MTEVESLVPHTSLFCNEDIAVGSGSPWRPLRLCETQEVMWRKR